MQPSLLMLGVLALGMVLGAPDPAIGQSSAPAAECELRHATFEPRFASGRFVLRGTEDAGSLRLELVLSSTGERFPFGVEPMPGSGRAMRLRSLVDAGTPAAGLQAEFRMANGVFATVQDGPVRSLSFLDLARTFQALRAAQGRRDAEVPPSGLWLLSECRR